MNFLDDLNPKQRQAVSAPPGAVLVLAGPGSGKTRVLTHRIAYLIAQTGSAPAEIMAVTFTNRAAREMMKRVDVLLSGSGRDSKGISMGTFHAFAARMLRRDAQVLPITREFVIYDEADQLSLIRAVLKELNLDPKQTPPGRIQNAISTAKNELIEPQEFNSGSYFNEIVRRAYARYSEKLLENNAVDFDDLLLFAVKLLREHEPVRQAYLRRFRHLLVDEFQDTNTAQYQLLRLLAGKDQDLFVVGDPDQSIYRWRGADYRNVLRFEEDFPEAQTILLEQNYRSTQNILDVAMAVIDRHPGRQKKNLFSDRGAGDLIQYHEAYDEEDEAQYVLEVIDRLHAQQAISPRDVAVMYRTNSQSRVLEEAFLRYGQPYRLVGAQRFYGRREVKDLIAYLRLILNPEDQVSLQRVINTPPRGIGDKTLATLYSVAQARRISPSRLISELAQGRLHDTFPRRSALALSDFGRLLTAWRELQNEGDLGPLIDRVLDDVGYHAFLDDGTEEGEERWGNVLELRSLAHEFTDLGLTTFLEHVALISDQDTLTESQNAPTLLTLHSAKGLEFPAVIIIGLDDGLIPHQRSFDDPEAMEEERRLFYVGITRAKDHLILVRTFRRRTFGSSTVSEPSRYLSDLPSDRIEGELSGVLTREQSSYRRQTRWGWQPLREEVTSQYNVGMRVKHPKFGEGIVMGTRVDQDDEEVTVAFEKYGIKVLAASLANLETLGE